MRSPIEISMEECVNTTFDYIIVGSGAAGVATALTLAENNKVNILIIERGPFIVADHIACTSMRYQPDLIKKMSAVHSFSTDWIIDDEGTRVSEQQWSGVGGRTLYWGAHAPRFLSADFEGWPLDTSTINSSYEWAEEKLHITQSFFKSKTQDTLISKLQAQHINVLPSPLAVESKISRRSSLPHLIASSISNLLDSPYFKINDKEIGIHLLSNTEVKKLCYDDNKIKAIEVIDLLTQSVKKFKAHRYILAAGALNSTKLVMQSELPINEKYAGHFISEHLFVKGLIELEKPLAAPVFMYLPPDLERPYMFEVLGPFDWTWYDANNASIWLNWKERTKYLLFYSFGIGDIKYENSLLLSKDRPGYNVRYQWSEKDLHTLQDMEAYSLKIAQALGGKVLKTERQEPGRSLHERGGLIMALNPEAGITNNAGNFFNISNLYCTDAAIWPSQGASNPCLTIMAIAHHLAKNL